MGKQLILAVLVGLESQSALACPQEEFTGQLVGRYPLTLASDAPLLVAIQHSGQDIVTYVNSSKPLRVNSPGGRNSTDYVLVDSSTTPDINELCFYSSYAYAAPVSLKVTEHQVSFLPSASLKLLELFNVAGAAWLVNTQDSIAQSATAYQQLAVSGIANDINIPAFSFDVGFFSATSKARTSKRLESIAALYGLAQQFRDWPELAYRALAYAGSMQMQPANVSEAIVALNQALSELGQAQAKTGQQFGYERAAIENDLGEAFVTAEQLENATQSLDNAQRDAKLDYSLLSNISGNKGYLSIKRSEMPGLAKPEKEKFWQQSVDEHLQAIYFSELARNFRLQQLNESNLAVHYARIGERRKALVHFRNVLRFLNEFDNGPEKAFLLSTLGDYSHILGDYQKSISYLEESLKLVADPATASPRNLNLYCRLGTLYRQEGRTADALAAHRECLTLALGVKDTLSVVEARLQISVDYSELGNHNEAESASAASTKDLEKLADLNAHRRVWTQYATTLLHAGKLVEADAAVQRALSAERDQRQPDDKIRALTVAMKIKNARGEWEQALAYGEQAASEIEKLHVELEVERLGPAWSNATDAALSELAGLYLTRYEATQKPEFLSRAFMTTERARDASLRQRLSIALSNDTASLEEKKQMDVYSNISRLLADAGSGRKAPTIAPVNYYHQHDLLSLARLQQIKSVPLPTPLSLAEVQSRLSPKQVVLDYLMTSDALYILVIAKQKVATHKLARTRELESQLAAGRALLHSPATFSQSQLAALSDKLLPDLRSIPSASEILLVGHSSLYTLPFAALPVNDADGTYTPLAQHYALTSVPSLSTYFMDKPKRAVQYTTNVAVLADPVFNRMHLARLDATLPGNDFVRGWSDSLRPLPYTAQEARNIRETINGPTQSFTGASANRKNLSSTAARNAHVLHIATHGYFKSTSDDNVGLALSTVDENGNSDPGFITLTELFGYAFNNELVVISGCDTALGKEQAGVGLNSLSRGFLAQGAKHVIATLWPVSDRASAEFMRQFYRHLEKSKNVVDALQQAQIDMSHNPAYRNPYYWAGYVLSSVSPDATIGLQDRNTCNGGCLLQFLWRFFRVPL